MGLYLKELGLAKINILLNDLIYITSHLHNCRYYNPHPNKNGFYWQMNIHFYIIFQNKFFNFKTKNKKIGGKNPKYNSFCKNNS